MGSRAFLVAAVVAVAVAAAGADVAADRAECSDKLVALAMCLTFVQGQGQAPTPDCYGGLKTVLQTSPKCLCVLVKDRDDPGLDLKLNVTRALGLPAACSAPANISDCPIIHALCPRMWPRPEPVPDHWCGDCTKAEGAPLAARTMGGNLRRQPDVNQWRRVGDQDLFKVWMGPLWWSYYQLGEQARRCFAYCCIFPRRHHLYRDELVRLWMAEGFIRSTDEGVDIEDVGQEIFNQLLSVSFLQPGGNDIDWNNGCYKDYYLVHDLLHDLAEAVAGSDCFRIDNNMSQKGEGWTGDVPRDVRHLFVQSYDATLITEKILELGKLHTLIIYSVRTPVEKIVIKKILKILLKLRVLAIASSLGDAFIREPYTFSVPESISQLKHLRYLSFRTYSGCMVTLPSSLNQLYQMQLLDFGSCMNLVFSCGDLINLRHVCSGLRLQFSNISRLVSLQTIPPFTVRYEQGHEAKQLRYLNRLSGKLHISGLQRIKSREEALEVDLAAKKRLTDLTLSFTGSSNVAAEVLEGLCPPVGLEKLTIFGYEGSAYPNWMVGRQNGGPEKLQKLSLYDWSQPGPAPELKAFIHLRSLYLRACSWNALPGNMEHLSSLESLTIIECLNVRSLPTLPQSLEFFTLEKCDARLMKSCQTDGHPNWQKIQHVDWKEIY